MQGRPESQALRKVIETLGCDQAFGRMRRAIRREEKCRIAGTQGETRQHSGWSFKIIRTDKSNTSTNVEQFQKEPLKPPVGE